MEENILFWEAVSDIILPSKKLSVQSQQLKEKRKDKNKEWKLFKIKNEDTETMSMASF